MAAESGGSPSNRNAHWPSTIALSLLVVVSIVGGFAYADLRTRIAYLEARHNNTEAVPVATTRVDDADAGLPSWENCTGRLTQEQVQGAIGRYGSAVFACFNNTADGVGPTLVQVRLLVRTDGNTSAVQVVGAPNDALRECIQVSATGWRFDAPQGGCAVVDAPFMLGTDTDGGH